MSRTHYNGQTSGAARRWAAALAASLALAGCSLSMHAAQQAPVTTGSITVPVEVQQPLPASLAYSDAAKIGEAATAALLQASGGAGGDWVNARTGSSGTVEAMAGAATGGRGCQPFTTMVTSIGGVHHYSGEVCRPAGARPRVRLDEQSPEDRS